MYRGDVTPAEKEKVAKILSCFISCLGDKQQCLLLLEKELGELPAKVVLQVVNSKSMPEGLLSVLEYYGAPEEILATIRAGIQKEKPVPDQVDLKRAILNSISKGMPRLDYVSLTPKKRETQPKPQPKPLPSATGSTAQTQMKEKTMSTKKNATDEGLSKEDEQKINTLDITERGYSLILPEGLGIPLAIEALARKQATEEEFSRFNYDYKRNVAEGVVAFLRVVKKEYGFVSTKKPGLFQAPPTYIAIETAPGVKESVPWGNLEMPGIEGTLSPGYSKVRGQIVFSIQGNIKGKSRKEAMRLCKLIEEELLASSIYKGQAIMTNFPAIDEVDSLDTSFPEFFAFKNYAETDLILAKDIEEQVDANLFTPIKKTQRCRDEGISLKRSVLLPGPFGTGKTLAALVTANLCRESAEPWTFIYLTDVTRLDQAYEFAKQYQPCVIFAEDVDKAVGGERDLDMDKILNKVDGIDTKGLEIIMVLTTNSKPEDLEQAMLRPGRLDAVIPIMPPDAEAAVRLIRHYAGRKLAADQDLTEVGQLLAGAIPAFIEEVVKRSNLAALRRNEEVIHLTADDLRVTAQGMQAHLKLLEPREEDERSDEERAAQIVADGHVKAAQVRVGLPPEETNGKVVGRSPQPRATA